MASSDRGFDSLLDCRQSGDRAIPYALMHCLLCTRHVVNNDHAVLPPEGDSLTADSTLVMSAAVTEPAPVASIQVEQVLDSLHIRMVSLEVFSTSTATVPDGETLTIRSPKTFIEVFATASNRPSESRSRAIAITNGTRNAY